MWGVPSNMKSSSHKTWQATLLFLKALQIQNPKRKKWGGHDILCPPVWKSEGDTYPVSPTKFRPWVIKIGFTILLISILTFILFYQGTLFFSIADKQVLANFYSNIQTLFDNIRKRRQQYAMKLCIENGLTLNRTGRTHKNYSISIYNTMIFSHSWLGQAASGDIYPMHWQFQSVCSSVRWRLYLEKTHLSLQIMKVVTA